MQTIHPTILAAGASLPRRVQLRNQQEARLERIDHEVKFGLPLIGKIRLVHESLPLELQGSYHLWTGAGHFATDDSEHELDIVALINADMSLTPLTEEATA